MINTPVRLLRKNYDDICQHGLVGERDDLQAEYLAGLITKDEIGDEAGAELLYDDFVDKLCEITQHLYKNPNLDTDGVYYIDDAIDSDYNFTVLYNCCKKEISYRYTFTDTKYDDIYILTIYPIPDDTFNRKEIICHIPLDYYDYWDNYIDWLIPPWLISRN